MSIGGIFLSQAAQLGSASGSDSNGNNRQDPIKDVANDMAGYNYQFYRNDKRSNERTIAEKTGNCKDLADVAQQKLNERGVKSKLVLGNYNGRKYNGKHYWLVYKDRSSGQEKMFDPTAAAEYHNGDKAFSGLGGKYGPG